MANVLVTGGASGLGLGCARRFLARGDRVTIADIDAEAGNRALAALDAGHHARFEPVDLADADSITALAERLHARNRPIDVLVNNAGIYPPSQRAQNAEGHELCFAIAHLGHFRLTRLLWPMLLKAEFARVISISSLVQARASLYLDDLRLRDGYTPIKAYGQAKLACLMFAIELQRRLDSAGSRVRSYAAHPGVVRTQLGRNRKVRDDDNWLQRLSTAALGSLLGRFGQSPEHGAAAVIEAATTDLPGGTFLGPTGFQQMAGPVGRIMPSANASNPALAERLWEFSETITGGPWKLQA